MTLAAQPRPGTSAPGTLTASFAGMLVGPRDAGYDQVRRSLVFNGMHDRRPALIARCTGAGDVAAALSYARSEHLVVAVRGGGHSTPGYSSCDGGLVIDTGPIKRADIDVAGRTGRFGAGLTWAELDAATQQAFRPLLGWGEPWLTMVQPMPYTAVQQFLDPGYPWGILDYGKSDYLHELPDEATDEMVRRAGQARSPFSAVILCPLGGQMSRVDRASMALSIPDTGWMYFCEANSFDHAEQDREIAWARDFMAAMRPWSAGKAPPNFLEPDEGDTRLRRSYGQDKYRKLVALKNTYDPHNVFTLNGNIRPRVPAH